MFDFIIEPNTKNVKSLLSRFPKKFRVLIMKFYR